MLFRTIIAHLLLTETNSFVFKLAEINEYFLVGIKLNGSIA